jgi:cysteine-rich repeat protein
MTTPHHRPRPILILSLCAAALLTVACDDDARANPPSTDTTSGGDTHQGDTHQGDTTEDDTSGTSGGDTSGGDTSGGDTSGGDTSGGDTSGGDTDTITPISYDGLVINEVAPAGDPNDWIELYNSTTQAIDLSTLRISDRIDREGALLPAGASVAAGGYYLIYLSSDGYPGFQLGSDEEAALFAPDGTLIDAIDWAEGQSPAGTSFGRFPNGTGDLKTLDAPTPGYANQDNAAGATCGDGVVTGDEACDDGGILRGDGCSPACRAEPGYTCTGSPSVCVTTCGDGVIAGDEECDDGNTLDGDGCSATCAFEPAPAGGVVINEAVHRTPDNTPDWVELYNTSDETIDLSGWTLTDDSPATNFYVFPAGTTLAPDAYLLITRSTFGFGLSADDAVMLFNPEGGRVDFADWVEGDAPEGSSFGRFPNGTGPFQTLPTPTPGAAHVLD